MARPLKYDQQFTLILEEKLHDKFLNIFNIKVQSTAFCQKLNLQRSVILTSLYDLLIGIVYLFTLLKSLKNYHNDYIVIIRNLMYAIGFFFGLLGLDTAIHLKKSNAAVYKYWRIFITFFIPLLELLYIKEAICPADTGCDFRLHYTFIVIYFLVNIYFVKIVWSFNLRLKHGHELLIVHGKYLEQMLINENVRLEKINYQPPKFNEENERRREQELINMSTPLGTTTQEDVFIPKAADNTFTRLLEKDKK